MCFFFFFAMYILSFYYNGNIYVYSLVYTPFLCFLIFDIEFVFSCFMSILIFLNICLFVLTIDH